MWAWLRLELGLARAAGDVWAWLRHFSTEGKVYYTYYSQRLSYCQAGSEATNRAAMSLNDNFSGV